MKILNLNKLIFLIALVCISCSFYSCNKTESNVPTVTFWHFWSEPSQKKALEELIAKFEKENNCKVKLTELSWGDGKTKLFAAFNSNTAPDVIELGSDWIAQFSTSGVLRDLGRDSMGYSKFVEFSLENARVKNSYFAIPWVVDSRAMYVNLDLLGKAGIASDPQNLQELLQYADRVNNGQDVFGFGTNGSDPHRLYKKVLPLFWTFGGNIVDSLGRLTINCPANVAALNFFLQLSRVGMIETQKQLDAEFVHGKIAYLYSGSWLAKKLQNENPNLKYKVIGLPGVSSPQGVSFAGGEYLSINAKSINSALAVKLLRFLGNGANTIEFCKKVNEAGFPADKRYFSDPAFTSNSTKKAFAEQLKSAKMTPAHPLWLDLETIIEDAITKALIGNADAQSALNDAQYLGTMLENENKR